MIKKTSINQSKGFTLIEVSVVFAILLILAGAIFPSLQSAKKQPTLERAAYKLGQDLRYMQQMASETKIFASLGTIPVGYGIYLPFTPGGNSQPISSYTTYANCNSPSDAIPSTSGCNGETEVIKIIDVEKGVQIENMCNFADENAYNDPTYTTVYCTALIPNPDNLFTLNSLGSNNPIIFFYALTLGTGAPPGMSGVTAITLSLISDPNKKKVVIVNSSGLIEVK